MANASTVAEQTALNAIAAGTAPSGAMAAFLSMHTSTGTPGTTGRTGSVRRAAPPRSPPCSGTGSLSPSRSGRPRRCSPGSRRRSPGSPGSSPDSTANTFVITVIRRDPVHHRVGPRRDDRRVTPLHPRVRAGGDRLGVGNSSKPVGRITNTTTALVEPHPRLDDGRGTSAPGPSSRARVATGTSSAGSSRRRSPSPRPGRSPSPSAASPRPPARETAGRDRDPSGRQGPPGQERRRVDPYAPRRVARAWRG